MLNRRDFLKWTGVACAAAPAARLFGAIVDTGPRFKDSSVRCINVVNFIRGVEPRFATDLLLPVQKQMELIRQYGLPATWLLQFDALVSGGFVDTLKEHRAPGHEVGFWFEMNEMLCDAASVKWRGRPGYEWDHLPPVAFTIGYTPEERIRLADTAMAHFKEVWGEHPKSVASWNLDAVTMAHLTGRFDIDAYAVCRDQIATDGFTIWGAPIAGYFPSKTNCWSPALTGEAQIDTPVFRMLGQDPVHYYNLRYQASDGRVISEPDTMEPVWTSGRSEVFVRSFLQMIEKGPSLEFAYAQLGQENSFPWQQMEKGYPAQMRALAALRDAGAVHVETMGESGRRFKKAFKVTPPQAQVMLDDPFGEDSPAEGSVWYQSRFYRADLHWKGDLPYLRDITVYSDHFPQPFLHEATRQNDVEQRMPAVLDGYHWSQDPTSLETIGAGGFFEVGGERLKLTGRPSVREKGATLMVDLPVQGGRLLRIQFEEESLSASLARDRNQGLTLSFEWDPELSHLTEVGTGRAKYRWQGFDYAVTVLKGHAETTSKGWQVAGMGGAVRLRLAQNA